MIRMRKSNGERGAILIHVAISIIALLCFAGLRRGLRHDVGRAASGAECRRRRRAGRCDELMFDLTAHLCCGTQAAQVFAGQQNVVWGQQTRPATSRCRRCPSRVPPAPAAAMPAFASTCCAAAGSQQRAAHERDADLLRSVIRHEPARACVRLPRRRSQPVTRWSASSRGLWSTSGSTTPARHEHERLGPDGRVQPGHRRLCSSPAIAPCRARIHRCPLTSACS